MSVIDDYLKQVDEPQKAALMKIRQIIHQAVPEAKEVITYGMPGFKYHGKYLVSFAAFKDHLSLFPTGGPIEDLKDELKDFKLSRGTIQFTLEHPIPELLIKKILRSRQTSIDKG